MRQPRTKLRKKLNRQMFMAFEPPWIEIHDDRRLVGRLREIKFYEVQKSRLPGTPSSMNSHDQPLGAR